MCTSALRRKHPCCVRYFNCAFGGGAVPFPGYKIKGPHAPARGFEVWWQGGTALPIASRCPGSASAPGTGNSNCGKQVRARRNRLGKCAGRTGAAERREEDCGLGPRPTARSGVEHRAPAPHVHTHARPLASAAGVTEPREVGRVEGAGGSHPVLWASATAHGGWARAAGSRPKSPGSSQTIT